MVVNLPKPLEDWLRRHAEGRGISPAAAIEEAVRQYLESAAITDVSSEDVSTTQSRLATELDVEHWDDRQSGAAA